MVRDGLLVLACLSLSACAGTDTVISNGTVGGAWGRHDIPVTYTTADVRMITERPDPREPRRMLVCSEPAPDVAKALATATQAAVTAKGGGAGALSVGVNGGYSSAEALLELAGRSTALLGLRDGLFRACEAYANGAIGDDAYALVLSRYGQLMVTLFLAQDIASAARASVNSVMAPVVSAGGGGSSGGTGGGGTGGGGGSAGSTGGSKPSMSHVTGAGFQGLLRGASYAPGAVGPDGAGPVRLVQASPLLDGGDATVSPSQPPLAKGMATPPLKDIAASSGADTSATHPDGGVNAQAAQSIERLGEAYFGVDRSFVHVLMTACINEYDTTRPNLNVSSLGLPHVNQFLRGGICQMLSDPKALRSFVAAMSPPAAVVATGAAMRRKPAPHHLAH